jgi:hypothetical protein
LVGNPHDGGAALATGTANQLDPDGELELVTGAGWAVIGDLVATDHPSPAFGFGPFLAEAAEFGVTGCQFLCVVQVDRVVDVPLAVHLVLADRPSGREGERVLGHRAIIRSAATGL